MYFYLDIYLSRMDTPMARYVSDASPYHDSSNSQVSKCVTTAVDNA